MHIFDYGGRFSHPDTLMYTRTAGVWVHAVAHTFANLDVPTRGTILPRSGLFLPRYTRAYSSSLPISYIICRSRSLYPRSSVRPRSVAGHPFPFSVRLILLSCLCSSLATWPSASPPLDISARHLSRFHSVNEEAPFTPVHCLPTHGFMTVFACARAYIHAWILTYCAH